MVTQVVHGLTPADTEAEGYVGAVGGLVLLVLSLTALFGALTGRYRVASLTAWTGVAVAVGFVLYHALPFHSPMTNPYLGEPVGLAAWTTVALAIAAAAWAAQEGFGQAGAHRTDAASYGGGSAPDDVGDAHASGGAAGRSPRGAGDRGPGPGPR